MLLVSHRLCQFWLRLVLAVVLVGQLSSFSWPRQLHPAGVDQTRQCLANESTQRLAVIFLVDESSSIQTADIDNQRVVAVETAISKLALNLAVGQSDENKHIDVLVSVFGRDFSVLGDWVSLADGGSALAENVGSLRDRNQGKQTNYRAGLEGVEQEFIEYERENGDACKVLVWLSDGALYLTESDPNDEEASFDEICSDVGVAARLRNQGVYSFGIGLGSTDAGDQDVFDRMRQIVEGTGECGSETSGEAGTKYGQFIPVGSAEELASAFGNLFPSDSGALSTCPSADASVLCGEFRILVGAPTKTLRIAATFPGSIDKVEIVEPNGEVGTVFENGEFVAADFVEPYSSNGARMEVDVANEPGEWALRVTGVDALRATVALFTDAKPELANGDQVTLSDGDAGPIAIRMSDPDLQGLRDARTGESAGVSYELEPLLSFGSQVIATSISHEDNAGSFLLVIEDALDDSVSQGLLYLQPTIMVGDYAVLGSSVTFPVIRLLAGSFPQVDGQITATAIDAGDDDARVSRLSVPVVGPENGTGRVSFDWRRDPEVVVRPPGFTGSPSLVAGADSEFDLQAGERRVLQVDLHPNGEIVNGSMTAIVYVTLVSSDANEAPKTVALEVKFPMRKPFETGTFVGLLVVMLAILVLTQLFVAIPLSRFVSRVRGIPVATRIASGAIEIDADRRVSGQHVSIEQLIADSRNLGTTSKPALTTEVRNFTLRGFPSVTYKSLLKPKRVPVYVKRSPKTNDEVTFGSAGQEMVAGRLWGCVKPNLVGAWMVSVDRSQIELIANNGGRALVAQLLYFLPEGTVLDPGQLASKVTQEISMRDIRKAALAQLPQMSGSKETDGKDNTGGVQGHTTTAPIAAPTKTSKPDRYS